MGNLYLHGNNMLSSRYLLVIVSLSTRYLLVIFSLSTR